MKHKKEVFGWRCLLLFMEVPVSPLFGWLTSHGNNLAKEFMGTLHYIVYCLSKVGIAMECI